MKIKVVNQRLYLEPPETAEGTREYLRAEFSFSEEWDGTVKTAFFRGADGENHPKLLKDDTCIVPAEALAVPGRSGYPYPVHWARRLSRLISRVFLYQQP